MSPTLSLLLGGLLPLAGDPSVSLRYVRLSAGKSVLECRVTEVAAKDGLRYTSVTERKSEKMTLRLRFDGKSQIRHAEAVRETSRRKQTVAVVFKEKEAVLTRRGAMLRVSVTPSVIVTTAPDWSDIFQLARRYNVSQGGEQSFAGLWIHPVQEARQLMFRIEFLKEDVARGAGKKLTLRRYRVHLRSGAYLVWADGRGRVYRLMPVGKPDAAVVLEGYEKETSELR
jgi:hypothetical protein